MHAYLSAKILELAAISGSTSPYQSAPLSGHNSFSASFADNALCYYAAWETNAWEIGIGRYHTGTGLLDRFRVLDSSNGGAAVNWSGDRVQVVTSYPAPDSFYEPEQNIFMSALPRKEASTFQIPDTDAYYVYMGRLSRPTTFAFVEVYCTTGGAGDNLREVGIFSSPEAPNKADQTLTKIVAGSMTDSMTTSGMKRNGSSFNTLVVPGNQHIWAAIRVDMTTTQPTLAGVTMDMNQGQVLKFASSGALTGVTTVAAVRIASSTSAIGPDLRITSS